MYKKVYQLCPIDNTVIKIWDNKKQVAEFLNITGKVLEKSLWSINGYRRVITYKNFIWVRERDFKEGYDYRFEANKLPPKPKKEKPPKVYKPMEERNIKRNPVTLENIQIKEIKHFISQKQATRELGFNIMPLVRGYKNKGGGKITKITQWKGWKIYKEE